MIPEPNSRRSFVKKSLITTVALSQPAIFSGLVRATGECGNTTGTEATTAPETTWTYESTWPQTTGAIFDTTPGSYSTTAVYSAEPTIPGTEVTMPVTDYTVPPTTTSNPQVHGAPEAISGNSKEIVMPRWTGAHDAGTGKALKDNKVSGPDLKARMTATATPGSYDNTSVTMTLTLEWQKAGDANWITGSETMTLKGTRESNGTFTTKTTLAGAEVSTLKERELLMVVLPDSSGISSEGYISEVQGETGYEYLHSLSARLFVRTDVKMSDTKRQLNCELIIYNRAQKRNKSDKDPVEVPVVLDSAVEPMEVYVELS